MKSECKQRIMDVFTLKRKKPFYQFVMSKDPGCPYRIIHDGEDITPKHLELPGLTYLDNDAAVNKWNEFFEKMRMALDPEEGEKYATSSFETRLIKLAEEGLLKKEERLDVWRSRKDIASWEEMQRLEKAPSMFRLREDPPVEKKKLPSVVVRTSSMEWALEFGDEPEVEPEEESDDENLFTVRLQETETMILFQIKTHLAEEGTDAAAEMEYFRAKMEEDQNLNRIIIKIPSRTAFTTTALPVITRHAFTFMKTIERSNACVDVYPTDRIRTFKELGILCATEKMKTNLVSHFEELRKIESEPEDIYKLINFSDLTKTKEAPPEELEWLQSLDFFKAFGIMERLLSSNLNLQFQLLYHERLFSKEPVGDWKYVPQLLWTFSCPLTVGKAVTSISWSIVSEEIFAASYGKYLLESKEKGLFCLWNVKNTQYPERMAVLDCPTTHLELSKKNPRLAATSFWDGTVVLIDTVLREPEIMVKSDELYGYLMPLWQVRWFQFDNSEMLVACGETGHIYSFEISLDFKCKTLLKLERLGNSVTKGITSRPQTSPSYKVSVMGPAITVLVQHPEKQHIYLAGADDGLVYVCSLHKRDMHKDVFAAHGAAVTSIQFNQVDKRILLTAGCDFYIRIWIDGVFERHIIELKHRLLYIDCAVWSPVYPYLILAAAGHYVDVWNLDQDVVIEPVSSIENPYKHRNLIISFNPSGHNFLVGDMNGNIFVYGMTSIPKPPEFPLIRLAQGITRMIESDDERLRMVAFHLGTPYQLKGEAQHRIFGLDNMYPKKTN